MNSTEKKRIMSGIIEKAIEALVDAEDESRAAFATEIVEFVSNPSALHFRLMFAHMREWQDHVHRETPKTFGEYMKECP